MAEVMLQLGAYQFGIDTAAYERLTRTTKYSWQSQARMGQLDALQFTGPDGDTISLPGVIYPHFRGGLGQLDAMRSAAGEGKPLLLVDGRGQLLGLWAIEQVEEVQENFIPGGAPLRQRFTLQLRKYSDGA